MLIQEMNQERMEAMLLEDVNWIMGIAFDDSRSQEIVVQPLLTETLALVVSRAHPLAGERDLQLQALDAQPLILLSSEFATASRLIVIAAFIGSNQTCGWRPASGPFCRLFEAQR